jgi:hypothetical protein
MFYLKVFSLKLEKIGGFLQDPILDEILCF